MSQTVLLFLVFGTAQQLVSGSANKYTCPSYDTIVTPAINASILHDMQGDWYMLATNEPTIPSFCTCGRSTWHLDSDGPVKEYHYGLVTKCFGKDAPALTMKGEARDLKRPGQLAENMEFFNHSVAPYVPNMIFDVQQLPDGNIIAFNYACISKSMFSFNLIARRPTLTADEVTAWAQKQNARVGGVMNIENMHITDVKKCFGQKDTVMV